ncbi:hypothetical protein [Streptomyces sp. NPDC002540]
MLGKSSCHDSEIVIPQQPRLNSNQRRTRCSASHPPHQNPLTPNPLTPPHTLTLFGISKSAADRIIDHLGQAANNTAGTKTFLGARYRRIVKRAPAKKAMVAVARNILKIAWILICDPDARYIDLGPDWHDRHLNRTRKTRQAIRELEHLGYTVTLTEAA